MKTFMLISALLAAAPAAAEFNFVPAAQVPAAAVPAAPAPVTAPRCGHVTGHITSLHLLAQPARSELFSFPKNEAQFAEFVAYWTPVLEKFGMKVTGTEYKAGGMATLKYESPDGRVVRSFLAEKLHYNAKDPAEIKKLQHELLEPLEKAGLTPVASFTVEHEIFRPTFSIYYLARPEENGDRELRLRLLANGDDLDFDLLEGRVTLVRKDSPSALVYIGRELGFKSKLAANAESAGLKLAEYRKFLSDNGKDFIGSRLHKLDKPFEIGANKYEYALNMYFFQ